MYHLLLNGYDLEVLLMALENMIDSFQEHFSMDVYKHMTSFQDVSNLVQRLDDMFHKGPHNVDEGEFI